MSRWDEQFKNHPIHAMLEQIENLLNVKIDDISAEGQSEKRRISKLMNVFKEVFENIDPELTSSQILDEIHSATGNIKNELTNYNSNKNHGHLENANKSLDNVLIRISQLLSMTKRSEAMRPVKGLEKSLDELAEVICDKKQSLENEVQKVSELSQSQNEKLEALSNSIDTKKQKIDSLISLWQEQFSNDQNERNADFANDKAGRIEEFTTWKNNFEGKAESQLDQLINLSNEKITAEQKGFSDKISSIKEDANNKHKEILKLHGLVVGHSVAAGYLRNAEDEKKQADLWRVMTIIFIALTAIWLIGVYVVNYTGFHWERIIAAAPLTGVLLFGAMYSSKQSSLHRQNERRTRWSSLEMNAIGPFIESLSEAERNPLKAELGKRLFGQQHDDTEKGTSIVDENAFKTIIKGITDILRAR